MAFNFERENPFDRQEAQQSSKAPFNWAALPVETLMRYKLEIESYLPATKLRDINLEQELVMQYRVAQNLQAKFIDMPEESGVPLNQIVAAVNSTTQALEKLSKLQIDLDASENLKKMEAAFIKAVEGLPDDVVEKFFAEYEVLARKEGVQL